MKCQWSESAPRGAEPEGFYVRNRPLIISLVALVVVLAGAVVFLLVRPAAEPASSPAAVGTGTGVGGVAGTVGSDAAFGGSAFGATGSSGAVRVHTVAATEGHVGRPVRLTGNVAPARDVTLVSKVPGTVLWTVGGMGTRVEAGDPVMRLDDTELQLALAQATAGYAAAQANLARLEAGASAEEVAQVEAAVEQARLGLARVATMLERQERLFEQGVIPEETLLSVRTEHDVARLQYESALQQLALVRRGAGKEERDAVRAQVRQAEVAVQLAEQQLADTVIRAPFSGLLASQPAQTGMLIGGGTPVAGLVDIDEVVIEANVGEREVNDLQVGDEVIVTVDALRPGEFVGVIDAIAPVADRQTGTFPVRFVVANPDHALKPGMVARVSLEAGRVGPGPVVPADALVSRGGNAFVYVPTTDGAGRQIVRERLVTVQASSGGAALLRSGLNVGETVAVPLPGVTLRDGTLIQIVREEL